MVLTISKSYDGRDPNQRRERLRAVPLATPASLTAHPQDMNTSPHIKTPLNRAQKAFILGVCAIGTPLLVGGMATAIHMPANRANAYAALRDAANETLNRGQSLESLKGQTHFKNFFMFRAINERETITVTPQQDGSFKITGVSGDMGEKSIVFRPDTRASVNLETLDQ